MLIDAIEVISSRLHFIVYAVPSHFQDVSAVVVVPVVFPVTDWRLEHNCRDPGNPVE